MEKVPVPSLRFLPDREHRRPFDSALPQLRQSLVGFLERKAMDLSLDRNPRCEGKKLLAVPAREVRNRTDNPLLPQQAIREGGDIAHVDPTADDYPAFSGGPQRIDDLGAERREDECRIEILWWALAGLSCPNRA